MSQHRLGVDPSSLFQNLLASFCLPSFFGTTHELFGIRSVGEGKMTDCATVALPRASALDVLRAQQKDGVHVQALRDALFDAVRAVCGSSTALRVQRTCDTAAAALYALLAAVIPRAQTLGEEYCALAPAPAVAPARRALALLLGAAVAPVAASATSSSSSDGSGASRGAAAAALLRRVVAVAVWAHAALLYAGRAHQADVAHAALGIDTVALRPVSNSSSGASGSGAMRVLAGLAALRVVAAVPGVVRDLRGVLRGGGGADEEDEDEERRKQEEEAEAAGVPTCTLCLGPRREAAATGCGHVFCWECLVRALATTPECPLCRAPQTPEDVVRVYNVL